MTIHKALTDIAMSQVPAPIEAGSVACKTTKQQIRYYLDWLQQLNKAADSTKRKQDIERITELRCCYYSRCRKRWQGTPDERAKLGRCHRCERPDCWYCWLDLLRKAGKHIPFKDADNLRFSSRVCLVSSVEEGNQLLHNVACQMQVRKLDHIAGRRRLFAWRVLRDPKEFDWRCIGSAPVPGKVLLIVQHVHEAGSLPLVLPELTENLQVRELPLDAMKIAWLLAYALPLRRTLCLPFRYDYRFLDQKRRSRKPANINAR